MVVIVYMYIYLLLLVMGFRGKVVGEGDESLANREFLTSPGRRVDEKKTKSLHKLKTMDTEYGEI